VAIHIVLIVGARPNFMKAAPLMRQLEANSAFDPALIHTGQHYDHKMSQLFFDDLKMPKPTINLGINSGTHAVQTAGIMVAIEKEFSEHRPDLAVVFGDVNSTLAVAVVASKMGIQLAHVEAGLRSFDRGMPEEINRIVTDNLADVLFASEISGVTHLHEEGIDDNRVHFTGNIMIDSLVSCLDACMESTILETLSLKPREYVALTLHRPSNVDNAPILKRLFATFAEIGKRVPVVFPCHPRTSKMLAEAGMLDGIDEKHVRIIEPLGYLDFLRLQCESKFVLTDSGGIQEESTYLQIPCVTLRENTERPVTVDVGTNRLVGTDSDKILQAFQEIMAGKWKTGAIPELWDGHTAERIVDVLEKLYS